ncbi:hypothetical protein EDB89DRAFT_1528228 [Lactarius sanguifluus]|nr:hypothetical protein EDB89DRAFT_1528228 [Lactarius sanguifluus]
MALAPWFLLRKQSLAESVSSSLFVYLSSFLSTLLTLMFLQAAKDVRASHDALVDLFERIQFFLKRLGVHTRISPTKDMVDILVKIMAEVIGILSIATKEMQRSKTKMYLRKLLGRTDIEDALKRLDSLTQEEVRMAIAQVLRGVNELTDDAKKANKVMQQIAEKVDKIQWKQIEQDVRRWFSPPDPSVNYNTAREAYQEGTAAWFFQCDIFKEWELVGSLLWVHGKPGSGKSIFSSAIVKHVKHLRNASMAYFFFDFRDKEKKQDLRNFLTSLLIQLSAHSNPCRDIIFNLYSDHDNGTQQPSIGDLTKCLHEMLLVAARRPVYLIIDALDECPNISGLPTPRSLLLGLLEDLVDLRVPNLHICVTSRPEVDIKSILGPLAYSAVSLHDESGQKKDISDYVNTVVNSDRKMRKWRDADKKLVVEVLSEKADGMFRWVYCQLEVLQHCITASIRPILDQLPVSLDETYARVLGQIPQASQAHAHRLLQCLMVAVRPLRVEELAEVLAFEFDAAQGAIPRYRAGWQLNDQEHAVLSTCSSLIAIVDNYGSQVVQFSHFSVKEFLMSDRLKSSSGDLSRYRIDPVSAHTIVAKACLGLFLHLDGHIDRQSVKDFPLAEYASHNWATHSRFKDVASYVKDGIKSLFDRNKSHFATWQQICKIVMGPYQVLPSITSLHLSSLCGFSNLVGDFAMEHPDHINAIDGHRDSDMFPLLAALFEKHITAADILVKHGANVNIWGMGERTIRDADIWRIRYWEGPRLVFRDVDTMQFLLDHGADVNHRRELGCYSSARQMSILRTTRARPPCSSFPTMSMISVWRSYY